MITYIIIILVVLAIVNVAAMTNALDFEETGYAPQCFDCNQSDCIGCLYAGPCYSCKEECDPMCPFDPILGEVFGGDHKVRAEAGCYLNDAGEVIGTYSKEGDKSVHCHS